MNMLPDKIIDFHVHLFPDKLIEAIWDAFSNDYQWDVLYRMYYRESVEFLNKNNVTPIVYSNYAHKKGIAEGLNKWNVKVLDKIPNLYCFAAIHPDDDNYMEVAKNIISHPKVLGFKLQLLVQNFYPYDERLFPLYDLVMEKEKRILFHAGTGPVGNQYVGIKNFKKVLEKYPDIPANIAHMGALEYKEFMGLLEEHKNIYFDTSFTFFRSIDMGFDLDHSYLEQNKDRILYGSDFPNLIFPREEEINTLIELGLSNEFYQKVFFDNGMELIKRHSDI
jgi:uncharacterized protein